MKRKDYGIISSQEIIFYLEPYLEDLDSIADITLDNVIDVMIKLSTVNSRFDEDIVIEIANEITLIAINSQMNTGYFEFDELSLLLHEALEPMIPIFNPFFKRVPQYEYWLFYGWHHGDIYFKRIIK